MWPSPRLLPIEQFNDTMAKILNFTFLSCCKEIPITAQDDPKEVGVNNCPHENWRYYSPPWFSSKFGPYCSCPSGWEDMYGSSSLTLAKGDYVTQQSPMHHPLETIMASDCCNTAAMLPRWFRLGHVSQVSPLFPTHTI